METLLILHGAIGAANQLNAIADAFKDSYSVYTLDFPGHGGVPFAGEPFSMALFANNVLDFMNRNGLHKVSIFGYSMGGYVAMYLAKNHPEKVNKIVTLATKFHWDEAIAAREVQMLNPEKIEQKLPAFATALKERHSPNDWKQVLQYTADMMLALGADNPLKLADYETLNTPCLIMLGDRDKMVSIDETIAVYKSLPSAQMCLLPNTPHPIEQVNIPVLAFVVKQFIG